MKSLRGHLYHHLFVALKWPYESGSRWGIAMNNNQNTGCAGIVLIVFVLWLASNAIKGCSSSPEKTPDSQPTLYDPSRYDPNSTSEKDRLLVRDQMVKNGTDPVDAEVFTRELFKLERERRRNRGNEDISFRDEVLLTLVVSTLSQNRVRLSGKTNLPPGTKLMLSVREDIEDGFFGQFSCLVSANGEFESAIFGSASGLTDGLYIAEALMPIAAVQAPDVQEEIGAFGEHLESRRTYKRGSLVKNEKFGVVVSRDAAFTIGASPHASQRERTKSSKDAAAMYGLQLCDYLDELLEFKEHIKFAEYGFGVGGPYNKWIKGVESMQNGEGSIPIRLRVAAGDLLILGVEYLRNGNTERAGKVLSELKKAIDYDAMRKSRVANAPEKPDFRTWRDVTGRINVEAVLVSERRGRVILRKKDGETLVFSLAGLSEPDIKYIEERRRLAP